ncbi:MAG: TadE/TadG family type IV pilus assembly protein [Dermatophilaceae bacterium]
MRRLSVMRLARLVRSNVDRQLSPNGRTGETGAVAMLVAILLGTGVLLGLAAITIDTGSLLYERRQLQNGADAAALSIAQTCLNADKQSTLCAAPDVSPSSTLVGLVGANAADQKSDIASVCGSAALVAANPTAFPTQCPTLPSPGLVECPNTSSAAKYVEVRTSTRSGDGSSTILPPFLAQTLAGGNYSGETVKACARAAWGAAGPPGPVFFPVTFSYCDWKAKTGADPLTTPPTPGHYELPPAPGLTPGYGTTAPNTPWPTSEVRLYTQGNGSPTSCPTWNGHVAPGNFATSNNISCNATVVDGWVQGDTGGSAPCDLSILASYKGQIVYLPIFDCDTSVQHSFANCNNAHGSGDWYHISGYAAFYLTGFYFASGKTEGKSIYPPDDDDAPCNGPDRCVSGWFTTGTLQTTIDTSGAPGFGSYAVQLAG